MNRATKKKLMVIAIVLTFTLSSVAFVVTSITGNTVAQKEFKPLPGYVLDGDIDPYIESVYIQNGFTFLKYYYSSGVPDYINNLPDSFQTNTGQAQLFVIKIKSSEDFVSMRNINVAHDIKNTTQEKIFDALCSSLLVVPVECSLMAIQNLQQNQSNSAS